MQKVSLSKQADNVSRALGVLSYLGFLIIIPLFIMDNKSNFVKKHINCSLTLWLVSIILSVVTVPIIFLFTLGIVGIAEGYSVLMFVLALGVFLIDTLLIVIVGLMNWVCLIMAALGCEATLFIVKPLNILKVD